MKRNAIAGIAFTSVVAVEAHLAQWCVDVNQRIHGTTRDRPIDRFERDERPPLRPLPSPALPVRERGVTRRVSVSSTSRRSDTASRIVSKLTREVLVGEHEVDDLSLRASTSCVTAGSRRANRYERAAARRGRVSDRVDRFAPE
jgi:hypothetical protein